MGEVRHRLTYTHELFKTLGRELGVSDRAIDAIQGHAARNAGDGYCDFTIIAKARVIDALPDYDLTAVDIDSLGEGTL